MRIFLAGSIFLFSLAWFSLFQPWGHFVDPDAFYHAKMAAMLSEQGLIREFPWLDLTSFNRPFVNQHFLFHVLLGPFVQAFGMLYGNQIAAVFFAALCTTVFLLVARALKIRLAWMWAALFAFLPPMVVRLSLGKASPLAIALFIGGLYAFLAKRRWLVFLIGAAYVLTHGGWILLLFVFSAALTGELLYECLIEEKPLRSTLNAWIRDRHSSFWMCLWAAFGMAVGLLLHPYASGMFQFLFVQIGRVAVTTPVNEVVLGQEWYPYAPLSLLRDLSLVVIAMLVVAFGLVFAFRKDLDRERMRQTLMLSIPLAGLFALTLKSSRFVEYLAPVFVLWMAILATLIDREKFFKEIRALGKPVFILFACVAFAVFFRGAWATKTYFDQGAKPFVQYREATEALSRHAEPGERIFHSNWAVFPQLFVLNDGYRYVSGLDPTFLLEADPERSRMYTDLMLGKGSLDPFEIITGDFGARFAFIDRTRDNELFELLRKDERFFLLYEEKDAAVFQIEP